jgi:hypothetical protein
LPSHAPQEIGAHRTGTLALRSEHIAVDDKRLFVAEQSGEVDRPLIALKTVVAGDCGALGQRAPLSRNALDIAAQFNLFGEQCRAGRAVFCAFIGYSGGRGASDLACGSETLRLSVHRSIS